MSASGRTTATWSNSEPCALWTVIAKAGTQSFMDSMEAKVLPLLKARHDAM